MRILRILGAFLLGLMISTTFAAGQTWEPLTNQPTFNPGVMLLLTDGTVIMHSEPNCLTCTTTDYSSWYKLTPDSSGSYVNGTWTQIASPLAVTLHCILVLLCCPTAGSSWKAENTTAPVEAVTPSGQIKAHFTIRSRIRGRLSNPQKVGLPSAMLNP